MRAFIDVSVDARERSRGWRGTCDFATAGEKQYQGTGSTFTQKDFLADVDFKLGEFAEHTAWSKNHSSALKDRTTEFHTGYIFELLVINSKKDGVSTYCRGAVLHNRCHHWARFCLSWSHLQCHN